MKRVITAEQFTSAHESLAAAGIKHGDTVEVDLAVGVMAGSEDGEHPHIAYCSMWTEKRKLIRRGGYFERKRPIVGDVEIMNVEEVHEMLAGKTGIAFMQGSVYSNGHVQMTIDPDSIDVRQVGQDEMGNLRHRSMKPASLRFIRDKRKETVAV